MPSRYMRPNDEVLRLIVLLIALSNDLDHLASELGVLVYESLRRQRMLRSTDTGLSLTPSGEQFFAAMDIDARALAQGKRPLCRTCLDWSVRRHHLAGAPGAALLDRCFELGWARRAQGSRVVQFSPAGEKALHERFDIPLSSSGEG